MKQIDLSEYDTLPKLLVKNAREAGNIVSMVHKTLGIWKEYTWEDYLREVKYFAMGLKRLGFGRGDRLSIVGENEPKWYWAELAAQSLGGIVVGIFSDAIASEIQFLISHSESKFVVASDQEQVDKLLEIKDQVPLVKKVIFWDYKGLDNYNDPTLISWDEVRELGRKFDMENPESFMNEVSQGRGEDTYLFLYTSGTSGVQKGAIRTHSGMISSALAWINELKITGEDRRISIYSPAWIVEQMEGIAVSLVVRITGFFPESPDTAIRDMREVGPTIFFTASRIWEGLASTIQIKIGDASWLKQLIYNLFLPVGQKMANIVMKKGKASMGFRILHRIADMLVFARLRDKMGLRHVRDALTAGALLSADAFGYFWTLGIPIRQVYGLSEMAPITMHRKEDLDENTIGVPVPDVELKITEEGEITARGKGLFTGYFKNPEATEEALRDGWFHTGDWGHINERGHLIIFDRLKDAVRLKTGHKFAPQYIESQLKFSPYINDAIVIGDENYDYVALIINIEFANVSKWADKNQVNYLTFTDLSQKDEVYDLINEEIKRVNTNLPQETRVKRFANLYKQLDADEAELTRTRKVKRNVFEEKYKTIINALYGEEKMIEVEAEVRYRDGKTSLIRTSVQIRET